jgi:hypothetical protein
MKTKLTIEVKVNVALVVLAVSELIITIAFVYQNL